MDVVKKQCSTCNAWMGKPDAQAAECHARPPLPVLMGMQPAPQIPGIMQRGAQHQQAIVNSLFPTMAAQAWCREWQAREPAIVA